MLTKVFKKIKKLSNLILKINCIKNYKYYKKENIK